MLFRLVLLLLLAAGAAWLFRRPILRAAGAMLIDEDPLERVAVIVVSTTNVRETALEAAQLYRDGIAPRLLLPRWRKDDLDAELARRGVHYLDFTGVAQAILVAYGVPAEAITLLPGDVDGTGSEIAVVADWVRAEAPASLLYLTARNHTSRARRRLRVVLPATTRVSVRASRWDRFQPDGWWRRRGAAREVLTEYVRWLNTFVIGDPWLGRQPG